MIFKNDKGFSAVEVIIALATISLIGAVVYTFVNNPVSPSPSQNVGLQDVPAAPQVKSVEDLTEVQETLSEINIEDNTSLLPSVDSDLVDL
jgi:hypothetical protein